jgi:hypothetical protein
MEQGLAMMYGSGEGNTVKHYYAGDQAKRKKKMACKSKKKK